MAKKMTEQEKLQKLRDYLRDFKKGASPSAEKTLDAMINKVYTENCNRIVVNMMDIPRIFDVGRKAIADGLDLKTAIVEFVETIRTDKART